MINHYFPDAHYDRNLDDRLTIFLALVKSAQILILTINSR